MPSSSLIPTGLTVLLIAVLVPAPSPAQSLSDSLRAEALRDFHGPDRTGKDGPLAKAGLDLLLLYHEYRAYRRRGAAEPPFSPSVRGAQVRNGHVTIDAIATTSTERLHADLTALGLIDAAMAGRVVSGRLPITQVPVLAQVESLRGVVLPRAATQRGSPPPDPPMSSPAIPSAAAPTSSNPTSTGMVVFLGGVLGLLVLTEE
jgi:hypothetical protein